MDLIDQIKSIRISMGLSQEFMARELNVDQSTWSKYESGKRKMPADVAQRVIKLLNSPRVAAIYSNEMRTDCLNIPLLNNVSEDPYVILDVMIGEARELIEAAEALKLIVRNKKGADDLTDVEKELMYKHQEQIIDLIPAIKLEVIRMSEVFGMDLRKVERLEIKKLKERKYLKG